VRSVRKAPRTLDEERLVRLVARGDRAAFEELYRRTAPWMALRLRRRCADEQIVAEVMQETYLAVWRAAGAFAGSSAGGTAAGWLWTIAARRLVDAFRRRAHHAEPPAAAALPDAAPAAEEEALATTVGGDVGDALRRLAPELTPVRRTGGLRVSTRAASTPPAFPTRSEPERSNRSSSSMVELSDRCNLLNRFLSLPAPRMFMYGEQNSSLSYLQTLAANGVELAPISRSAHFPMYSNPPEMWARIAAFVSRSDGRA
jgi:RNA polymerase sigma-70 factor (ECF subfamily)